MSADDGVTRHVEEGPDDRSKEERKRDRQMIELLNELRVALPGVQILFAFLLTVPFSHALHGAHGCSSATSTT